MSKIQEITEAYESARQERRDYNDASYSFAAAVMRGLRDYFGCQPEDIRYFKPSEGFDPNSRGRYSQVGAMELKDDGFWHMGLAILFDQGNGSLLYEILFKRLDEKFIVKLDGYPEYKIEEESEENLKPFIHSLFQISMDHFRYGFKDFIRQKNLMRPPIGFRANMPKDDKRDSVNMHGADAER